MSGRTGSREWTVVSVEQGTDDDPRPRLTTEVTNEGDVPTEIVCSVRVEGSRRNSVAISTSEVLPGKSITSSIRLEGVEPNEMDRSNVSLDCHSD